MNKTDVAISNIKISIIVILTFVILNCNKEIVHNRNLNDNYSPPYYMIKDLREKDFSGSSIEIKKILEENESFTSYFISYKSENLEITGLMNVPLGNGPFPAVIINHGHYNPDKYFIGAGIQEAAEVFAKNGYVAIGSDYRNHGKSGKGDNFFKHAGYLYDVMYLLGAVKTLTNVDREKIGMWGFSLGGWLTLKASVIDKSIKVVALFAPQSSDDTENYMALSKWHKDVIEVVDKVIGPPGKNPEAYKNMSPINFVEDMPDYFIMHRGQNDSVIPIEWLTRLRDSLIKQNKKIEFYLYPGQGHSLKGSAWNISMKRTIEFFDRNLKD